MIRSRDSARVEDRYGLVFSLLLLSYVLSIFSNVRLGRVIALGLYLTTLLIAMRAAGFSRKTARGLSGVMVTVTLLVAVAARFAPESFGSGLVALWGATLTFITLYLIVLRVLHHEVISLQTVLGALSAYLLIGFMFAALFSVTANWVPGPFFAGDEPASSFNLQYFSFVTLTTTGYGDLTAASPSGRTLAVMEALLGQIFLVTLVARLVSVFGTTRAAPIRSPRSTGRGHGMGQDGQTSRDQV